MKLVIPMAGEGSRFSQAGYTFPKPLIDVKGKPMIQWVIENLDFPNITEYVFIVRKEHIEKYNIDKVLISICNSIDPIRKVSVVVQEGRLMGAALSLMLAKEYINTPQEVLVANSDQYIEFSKENFNTFTKFSRVDGLVFTFHASSPKWSFVKLNEDSRITEVKEKQPISNIANVGIFYYYSGLTLVDSLEQLISSKETINGEYYLSPSINYLIKGGLSFYPFFVHKMHGLGTPEDLEEFLRV